VRAGDLDLNERFFLGFLMCVNGARDRRRGIVAVTALLLVSGAGCVYKRSQQESRVL
jgi:hypothetical protein